ncbi:hypothetical protein CYMTET_26688 [Cymbomonas tetramitiformis]|uniref:Uncharacterized protein n=1 Tax=Cymbomonas tetramitiformis TaxID=36881 RepID=A0AAE0FS11_9CHLO|nr:hypothetical protein CYMTET_26688 [Cymbomonas tetramitiformis]
MDEYQLAESRLQETSEEQEQTIKEQEEQIEGLKEQALTLSRRMLVLMHSSTHKDMMMGQMRKARSTLIDKLSKYEGGTIWPGKSHSIELPEDELKAQGGPSPKASPLDEMFGPNGNALDELMTLGALENIAAKALKYLSDTYGIQGALLKICALPLFESAASPIAERADEPSSFRRSSRRMSSMRHLAVLAMQTNRMNAGFPVQLAISNPNHKGGSQTLKCMYASPGVATIYREGGYLLANTYCAAHHSVATSEKRTVKTGLNDRPKAGQFDAEEEEIYPIMPWLDTDAKMSENERVWGTMAFDLTHFGEGECMTWEVDSDDLRVHATNDIKLCVAGISRCVRKVVEEMVGIFEDIQLEEHDSLIQMPTEMRRGTLDLTRAKLERLLNKNVMTCMLDYLRVTQRPSAYLVQLCCALLLEVGQNSLMGLLPFEILNCKTSFIEMEKDTAWEASKLQKGRIQQMTLEGLWDEVCSSMGRRNLIDRMRGHAVDAIGPLAQSGSCTICETPDASKDDANVASAAPVEEPPREHPACTMCTQRCEVAEFLVSKVPESNCMEISEVCGVLREWLITLFKIRENTQTLFGAKEDESAISRHIAT